MRKVFLWLLIISVIVSMVSVFSLAGCKSEGEPTADTTMETEDEKVVIGLSMGIMNEMMTIMREAMEAKAEELGAEIIVTSADGSSEKQIADVESLIIKKPDVIFVDAVDTTAGVNIVEAIKDAGVKVIELRGVESDAIDCSVKGIDEEVMATLQARYLEEQLESDPALKYNMGYILGDPVHTNQLLRIRGFEKLADKYPDRAILVVSDHGNWVADQALAIMEDWLQVYPELNCIGTASDVMAMGVISALNSANKLDEFTIVSIDGDAQGRQALKDGNLQATVMMRLPVLAEAIIEAAVKLANDEDVPKTLTVGEEGCLLLTKDNVEEGDALAQ